ncbi:histidinol-phosphatase [Carboxylicivirga mesophila]|uniref:Histidinol-phosphatase n=1 Tax=Carboxylicivirga mesophila TaxID=1166478 RepID=A0ABS5KBA6_9BACT|nr:histidinol-phosphatase [Carboxylicivirga mesophila]MBS2212309.1 histidinol-phosphatase [Carboxylicivirga mesophila]
MGWTNYHGHCDYCDGQGRIEDYILKAIELKMDAIGISSHAPVPFWTDWNMRAENLPAYLNEVEELKAKYEGRIAVYKSLEVDYIPHLISAKHDLITNAELDYVVGSVHFIGQMNDGTHWAVDAPVEEFKQGLQESFDGDIKQAAIRYYELQREMIERTAPDIIGHMDKIKMHNVRLNLFDENEQWYVNEVHKTLELIKEKGVIVEINTKAYFRDGHLFPGPEHFAKIKELNIPITINSDAHHSDKLVNGFDEVAQLLLEAGFSHTTELIDGSWQAVTLVATDVKVS